jgi:hypothetical protein
MRFYARWSRERMMAITFGDVGSGDPPVTLEGVGGGGVAPSAWATVNSGMLKTRARTTLRFIRRDIEGLLTALGALRGD